jgi:DNA modification methylase
MKTVEQHIKCGDCLDVLNEYPDDVFDLIITSSPYVLQFASEYNGAKKDLHRKQILN